jgi:Lysyl oxidase
MLTRRRLALAVAAVSIAGLALAALASGGRTPTGGAGLYPDLQTAAPHHFTVQNTQQGEYLRFSNLIGNTGAGALRLRPEHDTTTNITTGFQEIFDAAGNLVVDEPVSEFVFHPAHNHWHITAVALFEIRVAADDGRGGRWGSVLPGQSIKTTFCLIDVIKLDDNSKTPERTFWDCFPDQHQGISAGWGDQYHQATEGQELEVTGAPPGVYYLISTSNPDGAFLETTTENNTAWTSFRLTRDSKGNAKIAEISHSPCSGTLCGEDLPNR